MNVELNIERWLRTRPDWQQAVVERLLARDNLTDQDIKELTELSKTDHGQAISCNRMFQGLLTGTDTSEALHLKSIGNIEGIDNLHPKKPLDFGDENPVIIYGRNGTGKTGYIRIINSIAGKPHASALRANVYQTAPVKQGCTIGYRLGDKDTSLPWSASEEPLSDLRSIDVFDTDRGTIYLNDENEITYSPRVITLFDETVKTFVRIRQHLEAEKRILVSQLPILPQAFSESKAGRIYTSLRARHTKDSLAPILLWSEADKTKLTDLNDRLSSDPAKLAATKRGNKAQLDTFTDRIQDTVSKLSEESCKKINNLKKESQRNRKIAEEGAVTALDTARLPGVGSETWRAMWEAARSFSQQEAYPEQTFPVTTEKSKCVLCHQDLEENGKQRLKQFESYVAGSLETTAKASELAYKESTDALPVIPADQEITTMLQAANLDQDIWLPRVSSFYQSARVIIGELKGVGTEVVNFVKAEDLSWLKELREISASLANQIEQHNKDTESTDLSAIKKEKNELDAKKWTSQQTDAILAEVQRLQKVLEYDNWIKATDTTAVSIKAGKVAEAVVTSAYVERFAGELEQLGAKKIKVELVKTRTSKGKALHAIRLKGATAKPLEILSEGEKRVIELAAFIADVTGSSNNSPIVFDDPISSLDQKYEEKVVERLVDLTTSRQVIVFTHRLSLLGLLNDKSDPGTVSIRQEPWGDGEPGDVPLFAKKPKQALNNLKNERLAQARKEYLSNGSEAYYPQGKSICTDVRILLERIVEITFLADVIQRHRREVNTKNKIEQLSKITLSDCQMIDQYMTKYSKYEHSQSTETPVEVPPPDEIEDDINNILTWYEEFKDRPVVV